MSEPASTRPPEPVMPPVPLPPPPVLPATPPPAPPVPPLGVLLLPQPANPIAETTAIDRARTRGSFSARIQVLPGQFAGDESTVPRRLSTDEAKIFVKAPEISPPARLTLVAPPAHGVRGPESLARECSTGPESLS